jgi:hypothetical protein
MDFRNAVVDRLNWTVSRGKLTRIKVAYGGGGKLEFQTPILTVDINAVPRFPGAFEMSVIDEIHDDFISFVDDIEVGAKVAIRELVAGKRLFSSLRKFTAFNDSKIFDVHGDIIENMYQMPGKYKVAMMLQLDGAWISERSWGIKLKVTELQVFSTVVRDVPSPKIQILRDGIQVQKSLFVDDDDDEVDGAGGPGSIAAKTMFFLDDD